MKLSEYIDNELHKGLHDIIYLDEHNNEINVNPLILSLMKELKLIIKRLQL